MKNFYDSKLKSKIYFKSSTLLYVVLLGMFFAGNVNAQMAYKADGNSQVKISNGSNLLVSDLATSTLRAEGDFVIENGKLDDIKSLKLSMPLGYSIPGSDITNDNAVNFKLTHVMVLPILKKVFVVGFLNMSKVSHRIDMEFNLTHNQDESITLSGIKTLKLSDYRDDNDKPTIQLASYINNDDLVLDMNFVFTKISKQIDEQVLQSAPIIALNQPKTNARFERSGTR